MAEKDDDLRALLKAAEVRIEQVMKENENLNQAYHDLMDSQKGELEQMVHLSEQIWILEDALARASGEKEEAIYSLLEFKRTFDILRKQAEQTLEAATSNASRLELAARVYEMASEVRATDALDRKIALYNAKIMNK